MISLVAKSKKGIEVKDVEIAQYYQDNKAQFMTQRLAHIQFANEQDAKATYDELQKVQILLM